MIITSVTCEVMTVKVFVDVPFRCSPDFGVVVLDVGVSCGFLAGDGARTVFE
jgi:hypothetical protein